MKRSTVGLGGPASRHAVPPCCRPGQGRASDLLQPLPPRSLRRAAAARSQIRWQAADASTDERHRQAWLDVGPIGQREGHQDNVKVRQHQAAMFASPSVKL
jgi:hypothetical protein